MKKILLFSLFVFFTACANATPTPAIQSFTETVAVATLNPATETQTATETAIPETYEERATRRAEVALAQGAKPNDVST